MNLLVVNNSIIKDIEIENWINELFDKYKEFCDIVPPYQITFCQSDLKDKIKRINEQSIDLVDSIHQYIEEYLYQEIDNELTEYIDRSNSDNLKIIILMENANILYQWGEANNFESVIKKLLKSNLWHEMSHFFDAQDHYDDSYKVKDICRNEKCLMRYGEDYEIFCEKSQEEIRAYFMRNFGTVT